MKLRADAPIREPHEAGPGDFVKIGAEWYELETNDHFGIVKMSETYWEIRLKNGRGYSQRSARYYAKREDFE